MMRGLTLVVSVSCFSAVAVADTAYIEPSTFTPNSGQTITVETSFNDYCCVPKYAVRSNHFAVIHPDGRSVSPDRIEMFANSSVIEQTLTEEGTTRITTGERLGRKGGEYVLLDEQYFLVNSDDADPIFVPEGTPILSSQTATVSDAYVTIGEPTWLSIQKPIGRLRLIPEQHPSTLSTGDMFDIIITFDGLPLVDQDLVLTRSGQKDRDGDEGFVFQSDQDGRVSIPLFQSGTHVIMNRLQAPAPEGVETDIRSYTTSMTFSVN
ncbi:MAG: DUF4198 domain-containing protein [Henriciella sp.]|jgi:uncharacterized GH25 family protein